MNIVKRLGRKTTIVQFLWDRGDSASVTSGGLLSFDSNTNESNRLKNIVEDKYKLEKRTKVLWKT